MKQFDVVIIGAGIAGASIASEIGEDRSVLLLEAEDHPGYHSTGRSAAFWTESYGGPLVQPLTSASQSFLDNPPAAFSESAFLGPRGAVNIGRDDQQHLADQFLADFADSGLSMDRWSREQTISLVPDLKPIWEHAVYEPDCRDIDVAALHAAYLRDAKRKGVELVCRAPVSQIRKDDGGWELSAKGETYRATVLVNAAGAWADSVARLAGAKAIGIQPLIRNMVQIETDPPSSMDMPLVVGLDGSFYFKPEAGGGYWLSPHDEIPSEPADVAPDEMSVATAIDRFEKVVDVQVKRVSRKWAGLRSFAPDRLPVIGFDGAVENFFWFAGQGGFGIQTAPAAAKLARSVLLDQAPDESLQAVDASLYAASRFS
ncbi:FAD-dependent oxidoreductase [uncultured Parasphingorhabdus sp.]|uniref:NAD(P)/FAD-dependent oxidoreductase n=1 Tax=uncultured Parasphingorhabdus sp. TaxID=2709694 RepID=UPI0030D8DA9B|tara:strand:+ start:39471 stop:40586 length:1116 start_codon:yes stop_codon:yes gene_type:complete